jgi:hypothetical protein
MGSWVDDQWVWDLRWRRDLFVWELNLLDNLLEILNGSPISVAVNSWCWKHDPCGLFSIKSAYMVIRQSTTDEVSFFADELLFPPKVWKTSWAPSKVAVFFWQLLQDRLSTHHNLWKRGVTTDIGASTYFMWITCLVLAINSHLSGMLSLDGWVLSECLLVVSMSVLRFFWAWVWVGKTTWDGC